MKERLDAMTDYYVVCRISSMYSKYKKIVVVDRQTDSVGSRVEELYIKITDFFFI